MKISAIMISYNPDIDKLSSVLSQADKLFDNMYIFDNNSQNIEGVLALTSQFYNIKLECSEKNLGISGLNSLAYLAFEDGADFITIIDQDSIFPDNFRSCVELFYKDGENTHTVCAPVHIDLHHEKTLCKRYMIKRFGISKLKIESDCSVSNEYLATDICIGSGMTINKNIWQEVGGFGSEFFIDCADFDFCIKLYNKGIRIYYLSACIMMHEIGSTREKLFFFHVSMHSPIRHYFYFYSMLKLISKNTTPSGFKIHYVIKLVIQYFIYCFLIRDSKLHRKEINRAIFHFLKLGEQHA